MDRCLQAKKKNTRRGGRQLETKNRLSVWRRGQMADNLARGERRKGGKAREESKKDGLPGKGARSGKNRE